MRHNPPSEAKVLSAYQTYAQSESIPFDYGWAAWHNIVRFKAIPAPTHLPTIPEQLAALRAMIEADWELNVGMKEKLRHETESAVRECLHRHGWKTSAQIAKECDKSLTYMRNVLRRMVADGNLIQRDRATINNNSLYAWSADYPCYDPD